MLWWASNLSSLALLRVDLLFLVAVDAFGGQLLCLVVWSLHADHWMHGLLVIVVAVALFVK